MYGYKGGNNWGTCYDGLVAAKVFRDSNYRGPNRDLYAGDYSQPDDKILGNDSISSIITRPGYTLRGWKDSRFRSSSNKWGSNTRAKGIGGFNDEFSSLKVYSS